MDIQDELHRLLKADREELFRLNRAVSRGLGLEDEELPPYQHAKDDRERVRKYVRTVVEEIVMGPAERILQKFLTDKEATVIRLRCGIETGKRETLSAIGERYGLSRERIRIIEAHVLHLCRQYLKKNKIGVGTDENGDDAELILKLLSTAKPIGVPHKLPEQPHFTKVQRAWR